MSSPPAKIFKSAASAALALLESGRRSDVTFVVAEQQETIKAHKLFLVRSPVFEAMLERWETEEHTTEISVPEVGVEPFKLFLKYLYSDQCNPEDIVQVPDVLYLADMYDVPGLQDECNDVLNHGVHQTNVAQIYQKARKFKQEILIALLVKLMLRQARTFFQDVSFLDLEYDFLYMLIESDELEMKEAAVFRAVMRWAEHQCNQQNISSTVDNKILMLKDLIGQIRFPHFSEKEFTDELVLNHKGLLKAFDILEVFCFFHSYDKFKEAFSDPKFLLRRRLCSNIYTVNLFDDSLNGSIRNSCRQNLGQFGRGELWNLKPVDDDKTLVCVTNLEFQVDKHIQITAFKLADYIIDINEDGDQDRSFEFGVQFILLGKKCDPKIVVSFGAKYKTTPRILQLGRGVEITKDEKYLIKFSISGKLSTAQRGSMNYCYEKGIFCITENADNRDPVIFRFKKTLETCAIRYAHKNKPVCKSEYAIKSIQFSV